MKHGRGRNGTRGRQKGDRGHRCRSFRCSWRLGDGRRPGGRCGRFRATGMAGGWRAARHFPWFSALATLVGVFRRPLPGQQVVQDRAMEAAVPRSGHGLVPTLLCRDIQGVGARLRRPRRTRHVQFRQLRHARRAGPHERDRRDGFHHQALLLPQHFEDAVVVAPHAPGCRRAVRRNGVPCPPAWGGRVGLQVLDDSRQPVRGVCGQDDLELQSRPASLSP